MAVKREWWKNKPTEKELAGLPKNVSVTVMQTHDESVFHRYTKIKELGELKHPSAIPFLAKATKDRVRKIRYIAVEALTKINHKNIIPSLGEVIETEDAWNIIKKAVEGLEGTNTPEALPQLVKGLKHITIIRESAAGAMRKILRKTTNSNSIPILSSLLLSEEQIILPETKDALDRINEKMLEKTPKPTPKFAHYPFTLIDHKQHPKAFAAFCKEFFDPKNRGRDNKYWRAYAGQLKAASTSDGLK